MQAACWVYLLGIGKDCTCQVPWVCDHGFLRSYGDTEEQARERLEEKLSYLADILWS